MSENESPFTKIQFDEDGNPILAPLAAAILMDLENKAPGYKLLIPANLDGEGGWFQARYEPGLTMTVQKECLGTKFGASVFLALQALAPKRVQAEP